MNRCLIVCNYGIGNALMVMPILGALETQWGFEALFCTDHPLFRNPLMLRQARVNRLAGCVAPEWRRFAPAAFAV